MKVRLNEDRQVVDAIRELSLIHICHLQTSGCHF